MKLPERSHAWPLVAIACGVLIFFRDGVFFNTRSILWDQESQFYPMMRFTASVWRHGLVPLWNPYIFNGYPCFADPQAQTFYPINLVLGFVALMTPKVVYIQLVLHYLMAGACTYLYAGQYVASRAGRVLAALTYTFNGYMLGHFEHITALDCAPWLPLSAWLLQRAVQQTSARSAALAGCSIAAMIFCGHPQTAYFQVMILAALAIFTAVHQQRPLAPSLGMLGGAMLLAALLSSLQWLPSRQFMEFSNRQGTIPYELATSSELPPRHLATVLLPDFVGTLRGPYVGGVDLAMSSLYCGLVCVLLAPWAWLGKRRVEATFFASLLLLTVLICVGHATFVFKLIYQWVPGFSLFRETAMYRFGATFAASVLCGMGADVLLSGGISAVLALLAGLVVCGTAAGLLRLAPAETLAGCRTDCLVMPVVALVVVACAALAQRPSWRNPVAAALCVLAFVDFVTHGGSQMSIGAWRNPVAFEHVTPPPLARIQQLVGRRDGGAVHPLCLDRMYCEDGFTDHSQFLQGSPPFAYSNLKLGPAGYDAMMFHGIMSVDGYNPMWLKRYLWLSSAFRDAHYERFLDLCDVRFVVDPAGAVRERLARGHAYLATATRIVTDQAQCFDLLGNATFDPWSTALVERPLDGLPAESAASQHEANIVYYRPGAVRVRTQAATAALLVLADSWYPGWMLRVDGGPWQETCVANYAFMAGTVPPGSHDVEFRFRPATFRYGLLLFALGLCGVAAASRRS